MSQIAEIHSHPEVELWQKAAKIPKSDAQLRDENATFLDYLEIYQGSQPLTIRKDIDRQGFADYCKRIGSGSSRFPVLRAFFIKSHNVGDSTTSLMYHHLGVPLSFFRDLRPFLSSRPIGNALFTRKDMNGNKTSIDGYYQLCRDYATDAACFVWFSQSLLPNRPTTYVVVQAADRPRTLIYDCATASTALLLRPFVIDAFLLDDSVQRMSDAMLSPRYDFLKDEWTTFDTTVAKVAKIKQLYKGVREFRLLRDGLVDVKDTLLSFEVAQTRYLESISPTTPQRDLESVKESFALLSSKTNWMIRALTSLEDRASKKIDLQYNIENQEDNRTNLEIAKLTTDIAVYTQKDSSSMITMAAVTMAFLPGTFVSALFSMVFFNLDPKTNLLTSAPQTWYFAAITIPLTFAVFGVWHLWRKLRMKQIQNDVEKGKGGVNEVGGPPRGRGRASQGTEETMPLQGTKHG